MMTPLKENTARTSGPMCPDSELLASYVDGHVSAAERVEIEAHLARCEDCYCAFSETVLEHRSERISEAEPDHLEGWRPWMTRVAAGLAAAAALVIAVQNGIFRSPASTTRPSIDLKTALNQLDAAAGPYRKFQPRLTVIPSYRQLEPVMRSRSPSEEAPLAVREAAMKVEKVARAEVEKAAKANGTSVEGQRALAARHLLLGQTQRAVEDVAPLEQSSDAGVLSDVAAAYLARGGEGDATQAIALLERAVTLDPNRVEAWFNLGLAAETVDQPVRATEAWTRALALDATTGWAGKARAHLEKLKAAETSRGRGKG
jgi:tetratricopeptide (TPR) repeat protein